MLRKIITLLCCLCVCAIIQLPQVQSSYASEKEQRVKLLKEKLQKLQDLLVEVQEQKLKETPPAAAPWEPVVDFGLERPAYDQYVYLLAPMMAKEQLDSVLQQLYFFAGQDELKERGTLFVVPVFPLETDEVLSVEKYNRELAIAMLRKLDIPPALEGGLVVAPGALDQQGVAAGPLLVIDLAGTDQILRARIIELLQQQRLYTADGSIQDYLWELLQSAAPQAFTVTADGERLWLSTATD